MGLPVTNVDVVVVVVVVVVVGVVGVVNEGTGTREVNPSRVTCQPRDAPD